MATRGARRPVSTTASGYIVVNRQVKAATGVDAPERVRVAMELDTEPRTVRVPADLRAALGSDDAVAGRRSRSSRSRTAASTCEWVEEAKRPETRARRVAATVERVREGRTQR